MASQSTEEISLSDSESESEPEVRGKQSEASVTPENQSGDNETKENEDNEESKPEEKSDEAGETEASVYTEQDLTEDGIFFYKNYYLIILNNSQSPCNLLILHFAHHLYSHWLRACTNLC